MGADRNLLCGILAVQMNFISKDALIGAMNTWVLEKHRGLIDILQQQNALNAERARLVEALVVEHLKLHDDDPQRSLAALSSLEPIEPSLRQITDGDVQQSLRHLPIGGAAGSATTMPFDSSTPAGRFRILRPHAAGGLGQVFVATDCELHREVALKEIQLKHADNPTSRDRFLLEAEITGRLEHPGVVPVYGLGTYDDGRPFYAMRFIHGDSLKEAIERFFATRYTDASLRNLGFRELLKRFIDVCNAIAYAHSRGVLHRDLKPGNVMLGKYGETLVVDWGLAKPLGSRPESDRPIATDEERTLLPASGSGCVETVAGSAVGTPAFMSPEQASGRLDRLGPASDVYSLGATLYVLLTSKAPFSGDSGEVLRKVQAGVFMPPGKVRPDVPAALNAVVLKAMALRTEDRYPTATALAAEIEHFLADEPVSAFHEPAIARFGRWARKHPGSVSGVVAATLVGLLGLVAGTLILKDKNNALARANDTERQLRVQAERNEQEARARRQETDAVLEFVEKRVFAAARPKDQAGGLGSDVALRDAVQVALPHVAESFKEQPLIEARLRMTLGTSFWYLGQFAIAEPQFHRAHALYTAALGPDHSSTLASMNDLAICYYALGRHEEALELKEETLKLRKAKLGPDHPDTLASMHNLANSYAALGRHAEALTLKEETLRMMKARLGPYHPHTLASMNNVADSYHALERYDEALALSEETLQLRKAHLGAVHPDTLESMASLANSYAAMGRHAEALRLKEETLRLRKAQLSVDHPDTLASMNDLAVSYSAIGRHEEALRLHEETLQLRKARLGVDHPDTLWSMESVASAMIALDRGAAAIELIDDCVRRAADKNVDPQLVPNALELRLQYFRRTGNAPECRVTAEMWEKLERTDAESLYRAACMRAVSSAAFSAEPLEAKRDADQAIAWLKRAIAAGLKNVHRQLERQDLDSVRSREDFQKLLAD